ncbi:MAG TPA: nucleotidyltransferase family protein, partial [Candidatus Mcinerneyibacterium sp.]|nr:nucleotidyltransferase family protein [Candidatus Mcinerneyibacterium sp.]
ELLTKRYTKSFLKRSLLSIFLNIKKESFNYLNKRRYPFLEIIDFNKKGQNIIKKLTKNSSIPLIHNVKKYPWKNYYTVDKTLNLMRDLEIRTNQLYDLL